MTFQGFTGSSKPLYIAVIDEENEQMSITSVTPAPGATSAAFSISGVANGTYELFLFVDNNNDGVLDLGDYSMAEENSPIVTVNDGNVSSHGHGHQRLRFCQFAHEPLEKPGVRTMRGTASAFL